MSESSFREGECAILVVFFPSPSQPNRSADRTWNAVRDGSLKRISRHDGDRVDEYLFNLVDDPGETRNLMEALPNEAQRAKEKLAEWEQQFRNGRSVS